MKKKWKILIFVVAYNDEKHIENVLNRIPIDVLNRMDFEILIIDDSSSDNTFKSADLFRRQHRNVHLKVLFNPDNLGYGGNQKLGYHYAIQHRFDALVLLHGDGKYAPERIEAMLMPILTNQADMVLGSRMMNKGKAVWGGMPMVKFVGNQILTGIQNRLLQVHLSEYHSGYRAYSVEALRQIPFERNSNDYHFDTQIIIQLLLKKLRIREVPVPPYSSYEIGRINGIKYSWNVIKTTLLSKAHAMSILYQPEYDLEWSGNTHYTSKLGYPSSHSLAIQRVESRTTVLELGCNQGYVAKELIRKDCHVVGMDAFPLKNPKNMHEFILANINKVNELPSLDRFDIILLLDVLEHLDFPESLLHQIRIKSKRKSPKVIITAPNVAFFVIRLQLLFGHFNYGKQGILDLTHKRLFTFRSLKKMCAGSGYKIIKIQGIPAPYPKAIGRTRFSMFLLKWNQALIRLNKKLFSYQIYMEIKPTPVVHELLSSAITEGMRRRHTILEGLSPN